MPRGSQVGSGNKEQCQLNMQTRVCEVMTAARGCAAGQPDPEFPQHPEPKAAQRCHQPRSESAELEAQAPGSPPSPRAHHTHRQQSNLSTKESHFQLHLQPLPFLKANY